MSPKEIICFILVILNIFSWSVVFEVFKEKNLEICVFDVGQGDAIFINTSQGHRILIDGGPDNTILEKLETRIPFWNKTVDLVILTHSHADHVAGLVDVLENYNVKNIIWTGVDEDKALDRRWRELLEKEKAQIMIAEKGLTAVLGPEKKLKIIFPFEDLRGRPIHDLNDISVVAMLESRGERALFTGDISARIEKIMIDRGLDLEARILKVAHHGSRTSTSLNFLTAVNPNIAIIPVGEDNRFGHPAKEVLERLNNFNIKVLRTDKHNDICLIQKKKKPLSLLSQTE